jgi:hypothetical protein
MIAKTLLRASVSPNEGQVGFQKQKENEHPRTPLQQGTNEGSSRIVAKR